MLASPHFSHSLGKVLLSVFRGCKKVKSDIVLETRPTRLFYKIEEQSVEIFRKVCEICGLVFNGLGQGQGIILPYVNIYSWHTYCILILNKEY